MGYVLGLDVGETSLGWCILKKENSEIKKIEDMGVRIFSNSREAKSQEPLSVARRNAKGARRNRDRKKQRLANLIILLKEEGLLPKENDAFKELEKKNPYELRARALDEVLGPYMMGRALLHICQRRGFKSNRKSDKKDSDASGMKIAMQDLSKKIGEAGKRTLGEYLYSLQKENDHAQLRVNVSDIKGKNVYSIFPNRMMYEKEVNLILEKQKIANELKEKIKKSIFDQTPLLQPEVGRCLFEENEKRAPKASMAFQEFRILQTLNNLEFDDLINGECLTDDQRKIIKELLDNSKEAKFDAIRKKIKSGLKFNLEDEKRSSVLGNETNFLMKNKKAFGDKWQKFLFKNKEEIIFVLLNEEDEEKVFKYLRECGLEDENIEYVANIELPSGYGNLSEKALLKILPFMRQGTEYSEACKQAGYHHSDFETKEYERLPYYGEILSKEVLGGKMQPEFKDFPEKYYGKVNNPTVHIGLNQIRKLVNELIAKYGSFSDSDIVIEFSRELKANKKKKAALLKEQAENTKKNKEINEKLSSELKIVTPSYDDRMKYKLWEDLNPDDIFKRSCPFCGDQIPFGELFSSKFEVEHLIPFSRSFDDSRANKVICCQSCNRQKKNKTPFEAFGADQKRWIEIKDRVRGMPKNRWGRFTEDAKQEEKFLARALNDTAYLAVLTKKYLSCICPKNNIRAISGQLTALLRQAWGLNTILNDEDVKNRDDHRHHALDAFVISCVSDTFLQKAAKESEKSWHKKQKIFSGEILPFDNFNREKLIQLVFKMIVSHKPDHKGVEKALKDGKTVSVLHEASNYGRNKKTGAFMIRKPLIDLMKEKDIDQIADDAIREKVKKVLSNIADETKRKEAILDFMQETGTKKVRIHVKKTESTMASICPKGSDKPYRHVPKGNNYCVDIYCPNRGEDKGEWCCEVISAFDVHKKGFIPRWRIKEPEAKKIMRLFIDDLVAYEENGATVVARVKKMSGKIIYLRPHHIAYKPDQVIKENGHPVFKKNKIKIMHPDGTWQSGQLNINDVVEYKEKIKCRVEKIDKDGVVLESCDELNKKDPVRIKGEVNMRKMDDIGEQFSASKLQKMQARKIKVDVSGRVFDPYGRGSHGGTNH
ncbi:MAG: type II CRISPR RNA-guided endonuclease Cas9 [Lactobacillales bacterium]|jgi:CRISPR-associated endonuclease Csn1|nr:type II CRISPR RNA-guided endonuclease Cas9 [Lactobacillales bacterium]